ncbi:MAG: formate dehydrogenase accessory sulfurtransferase FdhD [Planctomycetota bacterium]
MSGRSPMWAAARPVRWEAGSGPAARDDRVAVEEPLEVRVGGEAVVVTMRTPGAVGESLDQQDRELAAGFLVTEGVVDGPGAILRIDPCVKAEDGNVINVHLHDGVEVDLERLRRHVYVSSSCGVCGKASIESVRQRFEPIREAEGEPTTRVEASVLLSLPDRLRAAQDTFEQTGGLHAAGLFDLAGEPIVVREDVGRHNAVDKVIGFAALGGLLPLRRAVLVVSGRVSFEIVQKALAAGVPIVAAVSAPSSLAVEFAEESGQTLAGFVRPPRMNVYTRADRVMG